MELMIVFVLIIGLVVFLKSQSDDSYVGGDGSGDDGADDNSDLQNEVNSILKKMSDGNVSLPIVEDRGQTIDIRIRRNETVLGKVEYVYLMEYKRDGYIGGHGVTYRLKLAKGLYYRIGGGRVGANKSWQATDEGALYITDKRIIFDGEKKNTSLVRDKLIRETFDKSGFTFEKENGSHVIFQAENIDITEAAYAYIALKGELQEQG